MNELSSSIEVQNERNVCFWIGGYYCLCRFDILLVQNTRELLLYRWLPCHSLLYVLTSRQATSFLFFWRSYYVMTFWLPPWRLIKQRHIFVSYSCPCSCMWQTIHTRIADMAWLWFFLFWPFYLLQNKHTNIQQICYLI